jgi:tRNA nucleotidyltransferase (CCA-adding enzyme)
MDIPDNLKEIFRAIEAEEGEPLIVGGAVRDWLLGFKSKDYDIEVFGISLQKLTTVLSRFGRVDTVGHSFGVTKLFHPELIDLDFSLPRRDSKVGVGHTSFDVEFDPNLSIAEACLRRDFTFNSMAWSWKKGLIDIFGGRDDLNNGILRHTSDAFSEDPLRVLRGFQFAGRFDLSFHPSTLKLAQSLVCDYFTISKERIWGEWEKWALKSKKPSTGLKFLEESGWIEVYPALRLLAATPQDPKWHPEGNVLIHSGLVCDEAVEISHRENLDREQRLVLVFAALCHDLGKPYTTELIDGNVCSRGHEEAGVEPTQYFLQSIGAPRWLISRVIPMVKYHLAHCSLGANPSDRAVRRLSVAMGESTIQELGWLVEADHSGRPPLPKGMPKAMEAILSKAQEVNVSLNQPSRLVMGRDLIELGQKPGQHFKALLEEAFQAQLDGHFATKEDGVIWVKENLL